MAIFGSDYDRDFGYRTRPERGFQGSNRNWGGNAWGTDYGYGYGAYDRDFGFAGRPYDRDFYKSRWQTDYGDPFGDRSSRTPMRMTRGEFHGYDRGFRGRNRDWSRFGGRDYYASNPMGYEPYTTRDRWGREGTWNRGYDRDFYSGHRDTSWF